MRNPPNLPLNFKLVEPIADKRDARSLSDRIADVLSESHREDTSHEFRLGLLQGALAIAMPQLAALEAKTLAKTKDARKTRVRRRSRAHA
jgi:hypothetical protein